MLQTIIIISILILDQVTKYLSTAYLMNIESGSISLIKGIFHLTYVENKGAAFSILQNQRWLFVGITFLFIIFAIYYLIKHPKEKLVFKIGLSMILGGAIGNLIDRVRFGYVVDFLDFRAINFAIFNVADSAVVIGSILLGYYLLFVMEKENKKSPGSK